MSFFRNINNIDIIDQRTNKCFEPKINEPFILKELKNNILIAHEVKTNICQGCILYGHNCNSIRCQGRSDKKFIIIEKL